MSADEPLRKTPLHALHVQLAARMVPFAGWDMPVQYSGVIEEHLAVREGAGLFDVSHMGELAVTGPGALALLNRLTPNDASKLVPGAAQYSAITTPRGTFVDDILVYCRKADDYLLVVNASNIAKDLAWLREHATPDVQVRDRTDETALLAVQGPRALEVLAPLVPELDLPSLGYYRFVEARVGDVERCLVSRTGYTGEDGFELYFEAGRAAALWTRLLDGGSKQGLKPCGLGARDTLRLEAKLPLYGNDIDEGTTVVEAGLGWIVKPGKGEFLGSEVLVKEKREGAARQLVGFEMLDRGIARPGHPVRVDGEPSGLVRSGSFAPYLKKNIGLAYLPSTRAAEGTGLTVEVRGKELRARVVATPFVPHRTLGARKRS